MPEIGSFGRLLIVMGVILVVVGVLVSALGRVPRLPGDIVIRRDHVVIYIPIVTGLLLSLILTLVLSLFFGRR